MELSQSCNVARLNGAEDSRGGALLNLRTRDTHVFDETRSIRTRTIRNGCNNCCCTGPGTDGRSTNITACMHLHFIAKNSERMGDPVTSIAEQVVYLVTGAIPDEARAKGDETSLTS